MKLPRKTSAAFNRHVRELRREYVVVSGNKVYCKYVGCRRGPRACKDHKTANRILNAIIRGVLCVR